MRRFALTVALFVLSIGSMPAATIVQGTWYDLAWNGGVGTSLTDGPGFLGTTDPGAPPWTFNAAAPFTLFVTDCCTSGDRFEVFDNAVSVGITPVPSTMDTCFQPPAGCVGNPGMSQASFPFNAGSHSFAFTMFAEVAPNGEAFFRLDAATPEPSTWIFFASGLAVAGFLRRRK
jgi:hypothetical protein